MNKRKSQPVASRESVRFLAELMVVHGATHAELIEKLDMPKHNTEEALQNYVEELVRQNYEQT